MLISLLLLDFETGLLYPWYCCILKHFDVKLETQLLCHFEEKLEVWFVMSLLATFWSKPDMRRRFSLLRPWDYCNKHFEIKAETQFVLSLKQKCIPKHFEGKPDTRFVLFLKQRCILKYFRVKPTMQFIMSLLSVFWSKIWDMVCYVHGIVYINALFERSLRCSLLYL